MITIGQGLGWKPETIEAVVQTDSGFGLPDDPAVLPAIPQNMLVHDLDNPPQSTEIEHDVTT